MFMTSSQHNDPIKSGTNSHLLQPLAHPQPQQKKDHKSHKMKVVFLTLLLGLVCAAQEEEAEQSLRGTRDGLIWEVLCVCVPFVILLCGSIS